MMIIFAVGFSYMTFIMLKYFPTMPSLGRAFIINGCWIVSEAFSACIEITIWFSSFNLLIWCITPVDLQILKNPCVSRIKTTWSYWMIFLICCWIPFARILWRNFASMFFSDIGLYFLFSGIFVWFWLTRWWVAL